MDQHAEQPRRRRHWDAQRVLEAYGDYCRPRLFRSHGPTGYWRPHDGPSLLFRAWTRVVTMPTYPEVHEIIRQHVVCSFPLSGEERPVFEAFVDDLEVSLDDEPFDPEGEPCEADRDNDLRYARIPAPAAADMAGVRVQTIHKWMGQGLLDVQRKGNRSFVRIGQMIELCDARNLGKRYWQKNLLKSRKKVLF